MRRKYVAPRMEIFSALSSTILSGSGNTPDYGMGTKPGTGQEGNTGTNSGGGSLSKEHQFNVWEGWEE